MLKIAQMPLQAANSHCFALGSTVWCSSAAAGCQPAPVRSGYGAQMPLRAASSHRLQAPKSSFGAQKLLQAACRHRLEAALVLKCRCGLPARTAWKQLLVLICHCNLRVRSGLPARAAWKQLWCSNAAADCQTVPCGSSFCAHLPLRAASPHRFEAGMLKCRCGLPARTACKHQKAALLLKNRYRLLE